MVSEDADNRQFIREFTFKNGIIETKVKKNQDEENSVFDMYFDYAEKISSIPSHRILAINRGENQKVIGVKINL